MNAKSTTSFLAATALCTAMALGVTGSAVAGEPSTELEALAIELASTPAQHAAVARYYREQANEARAKAATHKSMKGTYAGGKLTQKRAMANHCERLIKEYTALAAEYDGLAAEHAKLAGN